MAAPALRNTIYSEFPQQGFNEDDGEFEREEFFTGEPICPPRPRRSGVTKLLSWLVILGALYGGWSLWKTHPAWFETAAADAAALWSALSPKDTQPAPNDSSAQAAAATAPEQAVTETEIPDAPGWEAGTAVETATAESTSTAAADSAVVADENVQSQEAEPQSVPSQPAPQKAAVPRRDPIEKQAEAAGLNPDLSKALLKRLTDADFRNAAIAIKTALAETAESAVYTWPAKPKPNLALFEVRFVPGAAENCRRYVVTVTKDRWSTTAPPMEKCGGSERAGGTNKS